MLPVIPHPLPSPFADKHSPLRAGPPGRRPGSRPGVRALAGLLAGPESHPLRARRLPPPAGPRGGGTYTAADLARARL